jgi:phytoene desaturase
MGGMVKIGEAFAQICKEQGVTFHLDSPVEKIHVKNGKAQSVQVNGEIHKVDVVIGGADYHHIDQELLDDDAKAYSEKYWDNRAMAPSSLLYYIGLDCKLDGLKHHNLFFDESFVQHAKEIYTTPMWPTKPLFYACLPSKSDPTVAPEGNENLFLLIPSAAGLTGDDESLRDKYLEVIAKRLEKLTGKNILEHIKYKRSFATSDFISEYNSYKGNAYGLANTLFQTAFLKPRMKSKKVSNLYFTGQLTVPGPGLPPSIISGQVVADYVIKHVK